MLPEQVFPYPSFREGQKELADSVYSACKGGRNLVAEAMSGFGKTAAVLAGTIASADEDDLQILYVCRTKRQVFRVTEELDRFASRYPIRATSLFSKYDYCLKRQTGFHVSPETFKWYCSFQTSNNLCSYFLNVPFAGAKLDLLVDEQTKRPGSISELLSKGTQLHVCPYEVAKLSVLRSRILVTTYHYLFDENSRSMLFGEGRPLEKVVAVIDEAHNIRDYISGSSTTKLAFSDLTHAVASAKAFYMPRISSGISELGEGLTRYCSSNPHWQLKKESLLTAMSGGRTKDWLADLVFELTTNARVAWYSVSTQRNFPSSIIRVGDFLSEFLSSLGSDNIALTKTDSGLFLTDTRPSLRFVKAVSKFRSAILLSATINPSNLFMRSIGLDESSTTVHSATRGYRFKVRTVIDTGVTTRFKMRTDGMYSKVAERLAATINSVQGGVGIFLPSYAILRSISEVLRPRIEGSRTVLTESTGLSNSESDEIMRTFKSKRGCVLLAVQGGRFAEGEDFPGDEMDISVVVGLPLPPPSPTMYAEYAQLEADRFDSHEAYLVLSLLPALRKAFQCAGRHIRNPGKMGMVIFMDSRFAQDKIVELMPSWLRDDLVRGDFGPDGISAVTRGFFSAALRP